MYNNGQYYFFSGLNRLISTIPYVMKPLAFLVILFSGLSLNLHAQTDYTSSLSGGGNPLSSIPNTPTGVITGDFDNDGDIDVLAYDDGSYTTFSFYANNGSGSFSEVTGSSNPFDGLSNTDIFFVGDNTYIADFDGDGDQDIWDYKGATSGDSQSIYLENTGSSYTSSKAGGSNPLSGIPDVDTGVSVGDFDSDGDIDVLAYDDNSYTSFSFYANNGSGTYSEATGSSNPFDGIADGNIFYAANNTLVADFDGDGDQDIWDYKGATSGDSQSIYLENTGNSYTSSKAGGSNPLSGIPDVDTGVSVGDFDSDGDIDVLAYDDNSYTSFSFYANNGSGTYSEATGSSNPFDGIADGNIFYAASNTLVADFDNDNDQDIWDYDGNSSNIYLKKQGSPSSNAAPTDISLSATSVNQSDGINATVGTLSTTDTDGGDTHSYSLVSGTGDNDNASFNISGSTLRANDVSNLAAGNYSVRIQTDDGNGGTYEETFTVTVNDDVAPTFQNSTPSVSATTESKTTLATQLNEVGTAYYVVVSDGDGAPSAAQVKAGQNSSNSTAIANGSINVSSASQDFTDEVTGLNPNTAYDIYVAAEDDASPPNLQNNSKKVDVTTDMPAIGNILYVDKNASGGNGSGNSWANALPELADALTYAQQNESNWTSANPLQIWVAEGVYTPVSPADPNSVTQAERETSFQLVNNVEVYGGFAGTESALNERNWSSNITVLSGDIDDNDTVNSNGVVTDTDNISGANSYSVVTGTGTDETAILDGLNITAGYAQSCQSFRTDPGCAGAGMYNGISSNFRLLNLRFIGNRAATLGGAMFNDVNSDPTLINVSIVDNRAGQEGGAMRNRGASLTVINSTITGNRANTAGGIYNSNGSNIILRNTILWDNTDDDIFNILSTPVISFSLVQGVDNTGSNGLDGTDPNNAPQFSDPANGDYTLQDISPAINVGDPNTDLDQFPANSAGNAIDLIGNSRIFDGTPSPDIIDMGAYEFQGEKAEPIAPDANGILYVDKNVSGGDGSGSSWSNAISELADALTYAQQNESTWTSANPLKIWVAEGIYTPVSPADPNSVTQAERETSFQLVNNVEVYGGFVGTESTLNERNWSSNVTVLSGDIDGNDTVNSNGVVTNTDDISGANSYSVVTGTDTDETAILNGLNITAGYAQYCQSVNTDPGCAGAGIFNDDGSFTLLNIRIIGNWAATMGGGMFNDDNSDPTLVNVSIVDNRASQGGAMRNRGATPILVNTTITNNMAGNVGGILNINSSDIKLTNSIVWGNTGDDMVDVISTSVISFSLVQGIDNTGSSGLDGTDPNNVPQFTDPANGDYTLQDISPAINVGDNASYEASDGDTDNNSLSNNLDLVGNPRLNESNIDLGAYEYHADPNRPPTFTSTPDTTATEGSSYSYAVESTDPDGDALTMTALEKPGWSTFTDHGDGTATLKGSPAQNGSFSVKLKVSDGNLSANQEFTLTVSPSTAPITNQKPTITSKPTTKVPSERNYRYVISAVDTAGLGANGALTFSGALTGGAPLPGWLSWKALPDKGPAKRKALAGTPPASAIGTYQIIITVADQGQPALKATQQYTLTVSQGNRQPTIASSPIELTRMDKDYNYRVEGEDPDANTLAFSATLADGKELPDWLSLKKSSDTTAVLKGQPKEEDIGTYEIEILAADNGKPQKESTQTFSLEVKYKKVEKLKALYNYPNPFRNKTKVKFELPDKGEVYMQLYNTTGALVRETAPQAFEPGGNVFDLSAHNLTSGIYIYRIVSKDDAVSGRLTLIR